MDNRLKLPFPKTATDAEIMTYIAKLQMQGANVDVFGDNGRWALRMQVVPVGPENVEWMR